MKKVQIIPLKCKGHSGHRRLLPGPPDQPSAPSPLSEFRALLGGILALKISCLTADELSPKPSKIFAPAYLPHAGPCLFQLPLPPFPQGRLPGIKNIYNLGERGLKPTQRGPPLPCSNPYYSFYSKFF